MAANVASLAESIVEERGKYFSSLEILNCYDKQQNNIFTDMFVMPAQERRYKKLGNMIHTSLIQWSRIM